MTQEEIVDEIRRVLANYYEPVQINQWLDWPQPLLGCRTPLSVINDGKAEEVLAVVRDLEASIYL